MPEETLESQVAAGNKADELRNNPIYREAMGKMKMAYFEKWLNSDPKDQAGRESMYFTVRAATALETELEKIVGTGAMASNALKQRGKK